jgi:hypothetical protein
MMADRFPRKPMGADRMLRQVAVSIALLTTVPAAFAADDPYPPVVTFAVFRNGENVGRHTLTFENKGANRVVIIDADIAVRALGLVAYRYTHHALEVWSGDQLQSLQATTDDNGRRFTVSAQRVGASLKVEHTTPGPVTTAMAYDGFQAPDVSRETLPASLLPTSQWNMRQVKQSTLLNTQYGTPSRVRIVPAGRETVTTAKGSIAANRFVYSGDLHMDQWFDDRGRWVKGTFVAFDGSTIEYILQE